MPHASAPDLCDPVSEVDYRVEKLIRLRLAERFPDHDIIGEEMQEHLGRDSGFIWAVDPIDGTTNFVNDLPLFSASIGILHRCLPVAGADAPSEICTMENNKWSTTAFDAARPKADLRVEGAAIGGIRDIQDQAQESPQLGED